jgi:hypothetical protein
MDFEKNFYPDDFLVPDNYIDWDRKYRRIFAPKNWQFSNFFIHVVTWDWAPVFNRQRVFAWTSNEIFHWDCTSCSEEGTLFKSYEERRIIGRRRWTESII